MRFSIFRLTVGMASSQARSLAVSGGWVVVVGATVVGVVIAAAATSCDDAPCPAGRGAFPA
jgi:hypothetical protein